MVFYTREEVCPICGVNARVTRKWVRNQYGKRYDYFIYHHQGYIHYSNQDVKSSKSFRKGELERALMEVINSQDFKLGSFQISEIRKLLAKDFPVVGFGSLKTSLNRLTEIGILERQKRGRNLFFINTVSKDRLSYVIDSLMVSLEDTENDVSFKRHLFVYSISNDHSWPLYYVPFRAVGDVDATLDSLKLNSYDLTNKKDIKVMLVEDAPKDKRFLLRLPTPLFPGEFRNISIRYDWSEPKQMFVYSSATKMKRFEFSLLSKHTSKLGVFLTSSTSNETTDLSNEITETSTLKWEFVRTIGLSDVEPFAVIQLKWK